MVNKDVRQMIFEKELTFAAVAAGCGFSREYLSRLLQKPLTARNREKVLAGIKAAEEQRE